MRLLRPRLFRDQVPLLPRRRLPKDKVVLQLQGDDIFLNAMPPAARASSTESGMHASAGACAAPATVSRLSTSATFKREG